MLVGMKTFLLFFCLLNLDLFAEASVLPHRKRTQAIAARKFTRHRRESNSNSNTNSCENSQGIVSIIEKTLIPKIKQVVAKKGQTFDQKTITTLVKILNVLLKVLQKVDSLLDGKHTKLCLNKLLNAVGNLNQLLPDLIKMCQNFNDGKGIKKEKGLSDALKALVDFLKSLKVEKYKPENIQKNCCSDCCNDCSGKTSTSSVQKTTVTSGSGGKPSVSSDVKVEPINTDLSKTTKPEEKKESSGGLLGLDNILGLLGGTGGLLKPLTDLLNKVLGILGLEGTVDLSALEEVDGLLNGLLGDLPLKDLLGGVTKDLPVSDVTKDLPLGGAGLPTDKVSEVTNTASGATDTVSGTTDSVSGATDTVSGATDSVSGATDSVSGATDSVSGVTGQLTGGGGLPTDKLTGIAGKLPIGL